MWPGSMGTEEHGWVGGCGVTLARRVSRKQNLLKYLPSITANIVPCQQGPGTALQCLQPGRCPPQRSASGSGQKGIVRGQLCFRSQLPGLGRGRPEVPVGGRGRRGRRGRQRTGQRLAGGTRPVGAGWGTLMSPSIQGMQWGRSVGRPVGLALPLWDQDSPGLGALVASFWFGNEDREMCCRRKP